jgi:glycosyltransferase involved in cell wall biosynthesis
VLVLNSRSEGTPRALLEAMAMGLPGIGTAVGGIRALLSERGWLTQPEQPHSLTAAILDALSDQAKVNAFGMRSRALVEASYNARDVLSRFRQILSLNDVASRGGACGE